MKAFACVPLVLLSAKMTMTATYLSSGAYACSSTYEVKLERQ